MCVLFTVFPSNQIQPTTPGGSLRNGSACVPTAFFFSFYQLLFISPPFSTYFRRASHSPRPSPPPHPSTFPFTSFDMADGYDDDSVHTAREEESPEPFAGQGYENDEATIIGMDTAIHVRALSAAQMPAYTPTTRPTDEVMCSICDLFEITEKDSPEHYHRALDTIKGTDVPPCTTTFIAHTQRLLATVFSQVADYMDRRAVNPNTPCNILGGIIGASTVADILSAARESLTLYHKQCAVLRSELESAVASPSPRKEKKQQRRRSLHDPTAGMNKRRLSSVFQGGLRHEEELSEDGDNDVDFKCAAKSFVTALHEGRDVSGSDRKLHNKIRPANRVLREAGSPLSQNLDISNIPHVSTSGTSTPSSLSISINPTPTTPLHQYQRQLHEFKLGDAPGDSQSELSGSENSRPPLTTECSSKRMSRRRTTHAHATLVAPEGLEERLDRLRTLQFFDIISQTLTHMLAFVYDWQIKRLTLEGETSGVLRLAEWCVCRIVEEMYEDGVDPSCPLDLQFLFCVQGLAFEGGAFHYRRVNPVEMEVLEAVWGEYLPVDVQEGRILTQYDQKRRKEDLTNGEAEYKWYEWGVLTKAGFATSMNTLHTGPRLNAIEYGFRVGPHQIVESLGLNEVSDVSQLRLPSFVGKRPGQHLLSRAGEFEIPNLTLSAPPEGSSHLGSNKAKPHIRPRNPQLCKELEMKYKMKRKRAKETRKKEERRRKERKQESAAMDAEAEAGDSENGTGSCMSDMESSLCDDEEGEEALENSQVLVELEDAPKVTTALPVNSAACAAHSPKRSPAKPSKGGKKEKDKDDNQDKRGKSKAREDVDNTTVGSGEPLREHVSGNAKKESPYELQQFRKPDLQKDRCCAVM